MEENEELSSLERVRRRLYDPNASVGFETPSLPERPVAPARGWEKLKSVQQHVGREAQFMSGPARFFIVALLFFLATGGAAAAYLVWGGRSVSASNVDMAIQGPTSVASGDSVPLLIAVENRNPAAIQDVTLSIDFPDGTKSADDQTKSLTRFTQDLGSVESGGKTEQTVRAAIFGSEGQHVALPVRIEYRTDGSNATFVKNKEFDFTITSSPISVNVSALSQVSAGQSVTVDVDVKSNATTALDNVAIVAEYPFGFALSSASPQPTGPGKTVFNLGTLAPGDERHISVSGVLTGENNDDRVFTFDAGTIASADSLALASTYTSKQADIKLTKPFLATTLAINHDTSNAPVIDAGVPVEATVTWTNTLSTPITNAQVAVKLSGAALDAANVGGTGFYRSSDTTMLFTPSTNPGLAQLQPGDTGQGTITFRTKDAAALASLFNPSVTMQVSVSGQRLSESNVPENISATLTRVVKIGTNLSLVAHAVHSTGPFPNSGPWPPVANQQTTYTIVYVLSNSGNMVSGTKIVAALPSYVRFTGLVKPADGSLTYNDTTRQVTWDVGDVASGTAGAQSAAFQIELTPSTTQAGTSPVLISAQQVTGVDRFTGRQITGTVPALTTQLTSDPGYNPTLGNVH